MIESALMGIELALASNSPRRSQLLALTGRPFRVEAYEIDETALPGEAAGAYTSRLALGKARASADHDGPPRIVLGFDTTVALHGEILGKPAGCADARRMLRLLRGKTHQVYTAAAILDTRTGIVIHELCASQVPMRSYTDAEIEAYIASGDPLDKAGAYAIQSPGFDPVHDFSGCFASVMGLPLCHLERSLRRLTGPGPRDVPCSCQAFNQYNCPIWRRVLAGESSG